MSARIVCALLVGACSDDAWTSNDGDASGEAGVAVARAALTTSDCPSGSNVIVGTSGNDTLNGTAANDCIVGNGGDDTIHGFGGDDFLIGGNGNDLLYGDEGNDRLYGEADDDRLEGGDGDDYLDGSGGNDDVYGGGGRDTILGGSGADEIYGEGGDDTIAGDVGNDVLDGGDGSDVLHGGDGSDTIHGGAEADRIFGQSGTDTLYGDAGNDIIDGGAHADTILGGDGDDAINGDLGGDTLYGEQGEDALIGGAGNNVVDGGPGTDACSGTGCELAELVPTGCTQDAACASGERCIVDLGLCLGCLADGDGDGVCDSADGCPADAAKSAPGACGCGVSDADGDSDGTADCNDECDADANKTVPGICGCGVSDADGDGDGTADCNDGCPNDANKVTAGICGCGVSDADGDSDGTADCNDGCPSDANKVAAGICGCGVSDADGDSDGTADCNDGCPSDANKVAAGICGCGVSDADGDSDGTADCNDGCPSDANKVAAGICGCGVSDADGDSDGTADCNDGCPSDANKVAAGICGCGVSDADGDSDGTADCNDGCPADANKTSPGACGCGVSDTDSDSDGAADCSDECDTDPNKTAPGICGCGVSDADGDGDGTANCNDGCPSDAAKIAAGQCGCGVADTDDDGDGTANCNDDCPADPAKTAPGLCGCGVADTDGDGVCDPVDVCPAGDDNLDTDGDGTADACDPTPQGCVPGASGPSIIDGNVTVDATDTAGDLAPLAGKTCVTGTLWITGTSLPDLTALSALEEVGNLRIGAIWTGGNPQLTSLDGLENLQHVGALSIDANNALVDMTALSNLTHIGGNLAVRGNGALTALDGLESATITNGGLTLTSNSQLSDISALSGIGAQLRDVAVDGNPSLTDLTGLEGVQTITFTLVLWGNGQLSDLSALGGLTSVNTLRIAHMNALGDLAGLAGLLEVRWSLDVHHNNALTSLSDLDPSILAETASQITLHDNPALPQCEVDALLSQAALGCTACTNNGGSLCACPGAGGDSDQDGVCDPNDQCPGWSDAADADGDATPDACDGCPADAAKTAAGICGCGVSDADGDGDGTADCNDGCPSDANKVAAGVCGCGVSDADSDSDGTADCNDGCAADPNKTAAGACGCGVSDADGDGDGTADCIDQCDTDAAKTEPGVCGCGVSDADGDSDGTADCNDGCPSDANKVAAGVCGCGVSDADGDSDGTADCNDGCPADANKTSPGACGCGVSDTDSDSDGAADCSDECDADPNKTVPGICGCGVSDADSDSDGTADCNDGCAADPNKTAAGACGCGVSDADGDSDGTADCNDGCPADANKTLPGICGCGVSDADGDGDGTADCNDGCPADASKTAPGACGCGTSEADTDGDSTPDCNDGCAYFSDAADYDQDGTPDGCDPCPQDGTDGCDDVTSFDTLSALTGLESRATAVNANGRTIVGWHYDGLTRGGFRYNANDGLSALAPATTGSPSTEAASVSADGQVALGSSRSPSSSWVYRAVRWNASGAIDAVTQFGSHLGTWLAPGADFALGYYLAQYDSAEVFGADMAVLSSVSGGASFVSHSPAAASDDGSRIVVNRRWATTGIWETLLYDFELTNPVYVQHRAGTDAQYFADLTPDGTLAVGKTITGSVERAVTWSQSGGYFSVPGLSGCANSDAVAVAETPDVLRVVGNCDNFAYLWDGSTPGARPLRTVLTQLGIALPAYSELRVTDVSRDAHTLVGYGVRVSDGDDEAWVVRLGDDFDALPCSQTDGDGDGVADCYDGCPADSGKVQAGICGCGVSDADGDGDGTANCNDGCPADAGKTAPGICGCGVSDVDGDGDGTANCNDGCPADAGKTAPGICGCGVSDADGDGDGSADCNDGCPADPNKIAEGACGCGASDSDGDADGTADCNDGCPADASKTAPGICGCGVSDADGDGDGTANCNDGCPADASKTAPGICGCGVSDADSDGDGTADCNDLCPGYPDFNDADSDGIPDGCESGQECVPGAAGPGIWQGDVFIDASNAITMLDAVAGSHCITGSLHITGTDLSDLVPLSGLEEIAGSLFIENNPALASLNGLEDLQRVAGMLYIGSNGTLGSLSALSSLTSVGDALSEPSWSTLYVFDNASLPGCWAWMLEGQTGETCGYSDGWQTVACSGNQGTGSCGTLPPDFACVPGAVGPGVYDGDLDFSQWANPQIDMADFGGLTCVTGGVSISGTSLTDLTMLSGLQAVGSLSIYDNQQLTSLAGLENLRSVAYELSISSNPQLGSLSALSNLTSLGEAATEPTWSTLYVFDNASLPGCWAWMLEGQTGETCGYSNGWQTVACSGNQGTGSCGTLPPDFACVPGAVGPGVYNGDLDFSQWANPQIDMADFGGLTCVTGGVSISGTSLTDLTMLSGLQAVGSLSIYDNQQLTSLAGLENLRSVAYELSISSNPQLGSLSALSNLTSLGEAATEPTWSTLYVFDNASLPGCWAWMLEGQTGETCGYSDGWQTVACSGNQGTGSCGTLPPDFACVPGAVGPGVYNGDLDFSQWANPQIDMADFGGLTCVTGGVSISGTSLTDLTMLSGLQAVGSLSIYDNQQLTSLAGLENLRSVAYELSISSNPQLGSLSALSNLTSLGEAATEPTWSTLYVFDNASLPGCWAWMLEGQTGETCGYSDGWQTVACSGNQGTGSCGTLPPDFACVPGAVGPGVYNGDLDFSQWANPQIDMADFGGVTCVTGGVSISGTSLTDLSMLSDLQGVGSLEIYNNQQLTSLSGLENLSSIAGQLSISSNPQLGSLAALSNLTSLGEAITEPTWSTLYVFDNAPLSACWTWMIEAQTGVTCGYDNGSGITRCSGNWGTGGCGTLPPGFECVPGAVGPGVYDGDIDLSPYANPPISLSDLGGLTCVTGFFAIHGAGMGDLWSFSSLQAVGGELAITDNDYLVSVNGLQALTHVGSLTISMNDVLTSLADLSALTTLGDGDPETDDTSLYVFDNPALPVCWVDTLEDQLAEVCGYSDWQGTWVECGGNGGTGSCEP